MSWIKEIEELNNIKKAFIISLPILSCFWFILIVLFAPNFYLDHDVYVSIILAFCIAFVWYLINVFISVVGVTIVAKEAAMDKDGDTKSFFEENFTDDNVSIGIFLISFSILCLCILAQYFFIKFRFVNFLIFSFCLLIIFAIYQLYRLKRTNARHNRLKEIIEES